ncbi:hypothetical protein PTE30175_01367 [Pandoraea terrae]|uniref:Porin domain-containing protein n=1 Tax=Pandoraea terrae TaxID=1537710 RepID=A0A5E4TGZ4_9BURK|nr:porin [Pandoraea terrae]VVD87270.1 hypothetical protein PTE30175_01367 [Pandoraea terrae]
MRRIVKATMAVCALQGMQSAHAVDIHAGDWDVAISGDVNAYYTSVACSGASVAGTALAGKALGCGGQNSRTSIGNGLLPNALVTTVKSRQGDYDVQGTIGLMAAVATGSAIAPNSTVDVRQGFLSIGNADIGTFKLGRDYGIFGANAILGDMTLLGAGAPVQATQRGRVTLGHIGAGYTYLGTYGQFAYTSPSANGFQGQFALVSPVDNGTGFSSRSAPQVQAQVAYRQGTWKGWLGGKTQKFYADASGESFTETAVELGGSVALGPLGLLANVQTGRGLGILSDGDQGNVTGINYLLQASYQASDKLKLGLNYGASRNRTDMPGLIRYNSNVTLGAYYALTKSVTLVGELGQTRSVDVAGNSARMNGASVGAFLFF